MKKNNKKIIKVFNETTRDDTYTLKGSLIFVELVQLGPHLRSHIFLPFFFFFSDQSKDVFNKREKVTVYQNTKERDKKEWKRFG